MNAVVDDLRTQMGAWSSRTFLWLIKRELWEHRGRLIITPLVIGALLVIGVLIGTLRFGPEVQLEGVEVANVQQAMSNGAQYAVFIAVLGMMAFIMFFVITYYVLDTLYAERRDRSVLFWKSLPVSDLETVLSKLTVASVVTPLIVAGVAIAATLLALFTISIGFTARGKGFGLVWDAIPIAANIFFVLYVTVTWALWWLPVVAWGLLASVWAPRAPFLWAIAPIVGVGIFERMAFRTQYIGDIFTNRFEEYGRIASRQGGDFIREGQRVNSILEIITPEKFFSSPGLWSGLAVAAALIAATVWVRRYRDAG